MSVDGDQMETLEEIAERIAGFSLVAYHDNPDAVRAQIKEDILSALRHVSNRTCDECAATLADGSGYCETCDNFTMPSDFSLRWVRRTKMETALRNEREKCAKVADSSAQKNQNALEIAQAIPGGSITAHALITARDEAKLIAKAIRGGR